MIGGLGKPDRREGPGVMETRGGNQSSRARLLMVGRSLEHRQVGGIVYVSRQLLARIDDQMFEVRYLDNGAGRGGALGGVLRLLTFPLDFMRAWRCLRRFKPHVVHINTSLDPRSLLRDIFLTRLARAYCDRIVLFNHGWQWKLGDKLKRRHPLRWLCRRMYGWARHVIVLSVSFAEVIEGLGIPCDRVHVVPNPVDCDSFPSPAAATNPDDRSAWRLLFLARFVVEKGIYELIDALPRIRDACDRPVELTMAGDGPEWEGARRRCRELGVGDTVTFPGYVTGEAKRQLYENSHVFVFPSHREAFPIVLLEAMAAGLPLVTTRVGAIGEFVRNGEHGVLLTGASASDIERGLLELLRDPERVTETGRGNREYVRTHFDSSRIARKLENIYRS